METVVIDLSHWRGRKVLVTGHTGFKGAWLCRWLIDLGADVAGFSLPSQQPSLFDLLGLERDLRHYIADIRDATAIQTVVHSIQPEVIFHLAAQSLVRQSYLDPSSTFATNVMGTVNVIEASRATASVKAVLIITSDKCYENLGWVWPYRETDRLGGSDPYSASKGCAEIVVGGYRHMLGDSPRLATVRAGNVIGGGDWCADRLVPDIVRAVQAKVPIELRYPHAIRPWQHVLEPLSGYLMAANAILTGAPSNGTIQCWNFGPDHTDSVLEVAEQLAFALDPGAKVIVKASDVHEASVLRIDSSKARSELQWMPKLSTSEAISWTAEWYGGFLRNKNPSELLALTKLQIDEYARRMRGAN